MSSNSTFTGRLILRRSLFLYTISKCAPSRRWLKKTCAYLDIVIPGLNGRHRTAHVTGCSRQTWGVHRLRVEATCFLSCRSHQQCRQQESLIINLSVQCQSSRLGCNRALESHPGPLMARVDGGFIYWFIVHYHQTQSQQLRDDCPSLNPYRRPLQLGWREGIQHLWNKTKDP